MSISDKELLTFCNLSNLEMEYANIIQSKRIEETKDEKGKVIDKKELIINHTIYSLLKFEERGKNNFKKLREYYEIEEKDKYIEVPEYSIKKLLDNNKQPLTKTSAKKIAEYVKINAMMKEKRSNPELYIGSFL